MSTRRLLRASVPAILAVLILGACAPDPHGALEPLRGPGLEDPETQGGDLAPSAPVELGDLPDGLYADAPPGFGEVPLDEMDLPPDAPPPPIEGGAPAPAAPAAPQAPANDPPPVVNPVPNTPIPAGGSGGVAAATDYCELFEEYGTVMAAVDSALASRSGQVPTALKLAAQVHNRAAELDGAVASDHRAVATGLLGLEELLGSFGYDIGRLMEAMDSDPAVAARFEATQADASLDRTVQHVQNRCGVTII